jgi:hypothetical protein
MRPGDLSIVASALHFATKSLNERWDDTKQFWTDSVQQHFEENHVQPIGPTVTTTLKAINRLTQVMARAYEECS